MKRKSIYSIGYGTRELDDFLEILKAHGIEYLLDVRSKPFSKINPDFNQNELKYFLERNSIRYVYMGDTLGGLPQFPSCYDKEGRVDYEKLRTKDFFLSGIERLKTAYEQNLPVVLMCSESNPCECHRSKLIGRVLHSERINIVHIIEKNIVKTQADVINELNKGRSDNTLFSSDSTINTSRKAYL